MLTRECTRILVMITQFQMDMIKSTKIWYMDSTFKIVKMPFVQLFSIHEFVTNNSGSMKKITLVYILMSSRKEDDYVHTFMALNEICDGLTPDRYLLDYEKACWMALRRVYHDVNIKECLFHYSQLRYILVKILL